MNKNEVNKILKMVTSGETVKFNDLRSAASAVGIKSKAGVKKDELIAGLKSHAMSQTPKVEATRGPGRPKARPEDLVGYKVKIGLRYARKDATVVTEMSEGDTFATKDEAQKVVNKLLENGTIRVWGKSVRAKMLPRYSSKQ